MICKSTVVPVRCLMGTSLGLFLVACLVRSQTWCELAFVRDTTSIWFYIKRWCCILILEYHILGLLHGLCMVSGWKGKPFQLRVGGSSFNNALMMCVLITR